MSVEQYVLDNYKTLDVDEYLNAFSFSEETLIKLLGWCKLRKIIYTQRVSKEFIQKYVLDTDEFQVDDGDSTISLKTIERCQGYKKEDFNY